MDEPKSDGDEPTPNVDDVCNDVDPKRPDEVDALKGEELNVGVVELPKFKPPMLGVFGANGLEGIEAEKGLADDWPNVVEGPRIFEFAGVELNPIPPAG